MKKARYVLLKNGKDSDTTFVTKLEAAQWLHERTKVLRELDWSAYFTFKLKNDPITYAVVDIKTRQPPKDFDWRKLNVFD